MLGVSPTGRFLFLFRMVLDTRPSDSWLLLQIGGQEAAQQGGTYFVITPTHTQEAFCASSVRASLSDSTARVTSVPYVVPLEVSKPLEGSACVSVGCVSSLCLVEPSGHRPGHRPGHTVMVSRPSRQDAPDFICLESTKQLHSGMALR